MSDGAHGTDYFDIIRRRNYHPGLKPSVYEINYNLTKELAALKALVREIDLWERHGEPPYCRFCGRCEGEQHRADCLGVRLMKAAQE